MLWRARSAELELVSALGAGGSGGLNGRAAAARRAARELIALQSSDWSFMRTRDLAGDYPASRVMGHAAGFAEAVSIVRRGMADFRAMRSGQALPSANGRERLRSTNACGLAPRPRAPARAAFAWEPCAS
jgi:predicted glycosyl hydrolase (DUF1957 family)